MHADRTGTDDAFGHWLAGFIDGEGCFTITQSCSGRSYVCAFQIALRADDRPLLVEIQQRTGLGKVYDSPGRGRTKPYARWIVQTQAETQDLARFLSRYPLRGKKARDLDVWQEAVAVWCSGSRGRNADPSRWPRLEGLRVRLVAGRVYA